MNFFRRLFGGRKKEKDQGQRGVVGRIIDRLFNRKKRTPQQEPEAQPVDEAERKREEARRALQDKLEREKEEAAEKEADRKSREEQREQSRQTFNERYGTDWDKEEYSRFWDVFGDSVYRETFGSQTLIAAAQDASMHKVPFDIFVDLVNEVVEESYGQGWTQEDAANKLYQKLNSVYPLYDTVSEEEDYD